MHTRQPAPHRKRLKRREIDGQDRFITFSCEQRLPLLRNPAIADLVVASLARVRLDFDLALFAWVVMPEHVHLLVRPPADSEIAPALRSLKTTVARRRLLAGANLTRRSSSGLKRPMGPRDSGSKAAASTATFAMPRSFVGRCSTFIAILSSADSWSSLSNGDGRACCGGGGWTAPVLAIRRREIRECGWTGRGIGEAGCCWQEALRSQEGPRARLVVWKFIAWSGVTCPRARWHGRRHGVVGGKHRGRERGLGRGWLLGARFVVSASLSASSVARFCTNSVCNCLLRAPFWVRTSPAAGLRRRRWYRWVAPQPARSFRASPAAGWRLCVGAES